MKAAKHEPRTPEETWKAIEEQAVADEMERLLALGDEDLDKELSAQGFNPAEERAKGAAAGAKLAAQRTREAQASADLLRARSRLSPLRGRRGSAGGHAHGAGKLGREELLARIAVATNDPRLPARAAILFRKRTVDEASDEELEAMLEELETLVGLGDDEET